MVYGLMWLFCNLLGYSTLWVDWQGPDRQARSYQ